jgi:hypothetical protein
MMANQLGRAVLNGSALSADQQAATPDDRGSYGELMDAIDEIIGQVEQDRDTRETPPEA